MARPSSGWYFLLAVIFCSGSEAQEYDNLDNEIDIHNNVVNYPCNCRVADSDNILYGLEGERTPLRNRKELAEEEAQYQRVCPAEFCMRKCCPVGEVRPVSGWC